MKYKTSRVLIYLAVNTGIAFLVYCAINGDVGAERVIAFMAWVMTIRYAVSVNFISDMSNIPSRSVPKWISAPFAGAMIGTLVYHGIWVAAIGYFFAWLLESVILHKGGEQRKAI